jgi:hypothetical protein
MSTPTSQTRKAEIIQERLVAFLEQDKNGNKPSPSEMLELSALFSMITNAKWGGNPSKMNVDLTNLDEYVPSKFQKMRVASAERSNTELVDELLMANQNAELAMEHAGVIKRVISLRKVKGKWLK